jgi:bacterioferritin
MPAGIGRHNFSLNEQSDGGHRLMSSGTNAEKPFLADMTERRNRARQHMMQGAITPSYSGNVKTACALLNEALATELICVLRYQRHYFTVQGIHSTALKAEFLQHRDEERIHADRLAERIVQLGGSPNFSPDGLMSRSHTEYDEHEDIIEMLTEDLVAERIAIDSYREMAEWFAPFDSTTRRILEEIQAEEEEHADDLAELLRNLTPEAAT